MRDDLKKLTTCAFFAVFAAITGIIEGMLPLNFLIPVPGVKLGIANIFVVFAFLFYGRAFAFSVSLLRMLIVFVFSGNAVSLAMSLGGGIASFLALCFIMKFYEKYLSFIGVSAFTATFHGVGQLAFAYFVVGKAMLFYLPILLACCAVTGVFTGTLMNISKNKVSAILGFAKGKNND